tara:strand:+ start:4102 stop:4461 length:360 start_codon:yes stop_codon:yes gene_type:complete
MFCRYCGKELSDQALACTGCGMSPKEGNTHCPSCGQSTKEKQIMCTACGFGLDVQNSEGWSRPTYITLLILSFLMPLIGFIYGGIKANKAVDGSIRKKQAWHYIYAGIGGVVLNLLIMA